MSVEVLNLLTAMVLETENHVYITRNPCRQRYSEFERRGRLWNTSVAPRIATILRSSMTSGPADSVHAAIAKFRFWVRGKKGKFCLSWINPPEPHARRMLRESLCGPPKNLMSTDECCLVQCSTRLVHGSRSWPTNPIHCYARTPDLAWSPAQMYLQ